uniref:Carboxylic ester hydrolase n=1 Tax=Blastobotrys adeninivorans TaxID=409370 RepID=B7VFD0_BLAAD|nr:tannase Atan1p precursor [Blastobotrys adeninivorans]
MASIPFFVEMKHFLGQSLLTSLLAAGAFGSSLAEVCTSSRIRTALPKDGAIAGISMDPDSITANPVYNASAGYSVFYPEGNFDYCNVTVSYCHIGKGDKVNLQYWLPSPDKFQNRYLATGGGGYAINSGTQSLPGGVMYGAVAGRTDGGFGGFDVQVSEAILYANGSLNYDSLYMFGYRAIGEQTMIGQELARGFYELGDEKKIYTYYQGCSEGGREGWSQIQKFPDLYDGVIPAAPAFRYGHQQVNHLFPGVIEQGMNYYPPPCEMARIVNATIEACDKLDGKIDGVVSRTDLCLLNFDFNSTIGLHYTCEAGSNPMTGDSTPAQNGTVSTKAAELARVLTEGLHDSQGNKAYVFYQITAGYDDADTKYNPATGQFELSVSSLGGEWVTKLLQLVDLDNLPNLDNVTVDTLVDWMQCGWQTYEDVLQTTRPDLSLYERAGGKILTFHGESDNSIPAGSSVHFYESVRNVMYPGISFNQSTDAMGEWYRLYLVPGAAHCSINALQPNGPFPQTTLEVMIDWVENGNTPTTLQATYLVGDNKGKPAEICPWPLRPTWTDEGSKLQCVYDHTSINTWMYDFNAFSLPVY